MPVFTAVQWPPLSVERRQPPWVPTIQVPAYRVVGVRGSMARHQTSTGGRPVFTSVQVAPRLTERKTPVLVPAYRVVGVRGLMAREATLVLVIPVFAAVQWSPESVER